MTTQNTHGNEKNEQFRLGMISTRLVQTQTFYHNDEVLYETDKFNSVIIGELVQDDYKGQQLNEYKEPLCLM